MDFIEDHLAKNTWFAGEHITLADFQMSFAVAALLSREGVAVSRDQAVGMASAGWGAFNEAVHRTAALSGYGTNLGAVEAVNPNTSRALRYTMVIRRTERTA
jgi:glutathione S-transferase